MKNIMLVAPPAAGKGTQAELITEKYHIPHISTGDILRDISKEDTEMGIYVRETLSSGNLVKDEITYELVKQRLEKDDCKNGFIIDGFPRNLEQAIHYDEILKSLGFEVGNVISIDIDRDILEKRIVGRRICEDCGAIYNINVLENTPKQESVCDECGGRLYQRSDDNIEAFNTRYQTYLDKTEPIIKHYEKQGVLKHVDGIGTIEEVFQRIDKIIGDEN